MIPSKSHIYYWEDSFLKQGIAGLDKIREAEMLCKKFGKLWNKTDEIDVCDFKSSTQNQQHLGDMKSSDTEEMKSIIDSSSGDEDTSDTLEIDWVVSYDWTIGNSWD